MARNTHRLEDDDVIEWWESFDWDTGSFCNCGQETCSDCMTQEQWWSSLLPHVRFNDDHGVTHVTRVADFGALCGNTFYKQYAKSTDDVARIAGKAYGMPVTCFECATLLVEEEGGSF